MYLARALQMPYGGWDAVDIWNMKARFLAFGTTWQEAWQPAPVHPDYPPLLPLLIAVGWRLFGDTTLVPVILHGAVYLTILWLLRERLWALCLVGGALLTYAPTQYADTPLALALLGAVVAHTNRQEWAAGLALCLAALIKNEGSLMLGAFLGAWALVERRVPVKAVMAALPGLAAATLYRVLVGGANDVMGSGDKLERLLDWSRYPVIGLSVICATVTFAGGGILMALVFALKGNHENQ
jgi:hypothetical protein